MNYLDKKCIICQSQLINVNDSCYMAYNFEHNYNEIAYTCSLMADRHYYICLNKQDMNIREEFVYNSHNQNLFIKQYSGSLSFVMLHYKIINTHWKSLKLDNIDSTFDFINGNLDDILNKIKLIITFQ